MNPTAEKKPAAAGKTSSRTAAKKKTTTAAAPRKARAATAKKRQNPPKNVAEPPISPEEKKKQAQDANALEGICPFFQQDRGNNRISCEGGSLRFPDRVARREFVYTYCASFEGCKACPLNRSLEQYYERKYAVNE